jgi:indolepyruvate ferredoxin oxidoreductase beta subunit
MPSGNNNGNGRHPWRILTVGTGGQGVITAAHLLSRFFVARGHEVVSGQLHGMAQRGGSVQSTVMVDCGICPVIPEGKADFVLGLEPIECARALPFVSSRTSVFMNTTMVTPFVVAQDQIRKRGTGPPDVHELEQAIRSVTPSLCVTDATALAEKAGSIRTLNMVMLGSLFGADLLPYKPTDFTVTVPLSEENQRAFTSGVTWSRALS